MAKSLYSLILSDEVVERIDRMATRQGTNRSALVNQILAEYCTLVTPEKQIESVFDAVRRLFDDDGDLSPTVTPHQSTMFLKTSLAYRYRPSVRYDIRLYPHAVGSRAAFVGELTVTFRTQSEELLGAIERFFRLWTDAELPLVTGFFAGEPVYLVSQGRLTRRFALTDGSHSAEDVARALSSYVRGFDAALKGIVSGAMSPAALPGLCESLLADSILR